MHTPWHLMPSQPTDKVIAPHMGAIQTSHMHVLYELLHMLHGAVSPAQPAKLSPGPRRSLLRRHQVYDGTGSVCGSGGAAPLAARRVCPGAPPGPQRQGRALAGQAARGGRALLSDDGAQAPLVGALALLCASVAVPLVLGDPRQISAVGVCSAIAACIR